MAPDIKIIVKNYSDRERRNQLSSLHGLLFLISRVGLVGLSLGTGNLSNAKYNANI